MQPNSDFYDKAQEESVLVNIPDITRLFQVEHKYKAVKMTVAQRESFKEYLSLPYEHVKSLSATNYWRIFNGMPEILVPSHDTYYWHFFDKSVYKLVKERKKKKEWLEKNGFESASTSKHTAVETTKQPTVSTIESASASVVAPSASTIPVSPITTTQVPSASTPPTTNTEASIASVGTITKTEPNITVSDTPASTPKLHKPITTKPKTQTKPKKQEDKPTPTKEQTTQQSLF